jgi:hypothetical protein
VELVLSEIYRTTYTDYEGVEVEVFDASLRLVSHQFRRVLDDSVPCFAMLKLLKSEYQRVSNSDGSIDSNKTSPWLTHSEVSMILSKRQIDLNEPLPEPRLMPLTALQIVASTMLCACYEEYARSHYEESLGTNVELIYAVAGTVSFIQTIIDEQSPLHGKQILVQGAEHPMPEGACGCCWTPYLDFRICVTEVEAANLLQIDVNTPYDEYMTMNDDEGETFRQNQFPELRVFQVYRPMDSWRGDNFTSSMSNSLTQFNANMHYRRGKALWDQFPTLPPPIYRILTRHDHNYNDTFSLNSLINMIEMFKLNVIFKSHTSAMLRQLYSSTIESHNVEHLIADTEIIRRSFEEIPGKLYSFTARQAISGKLGDYIDWPYCINLQQRMKMPVPLTPTDLYYMFHVLLGDQPITLIRKQCYRAAMITELIDCDMADIPASAEIYSKYNEEMEVNVYYQARFIVSSNQHFTATIQILLMHHTHWFCMKLYQGSLEAEVMKECDFDLAKDLFEYW